MEKLDAMLRDAKRCGVYKTESAIKELEHAAARSGLSFFEIEMKDITDGKQFLREIATRLMFPDYFGENWDALNDCLTDLSWLPVAGYVIMLNHCEIFSETSPEDFETAVEIFEDVVDFWKEENKPFWVVLTGLKKNEQFEKLPV